PPRRSARRPRRPRPPRVADPGRLRRQEPPDQSGRNRPGAAVRSRRPRRGGHRTPRYAGNQPASRGRKGVMDRHLLSAADLSRDEATLVLDTAEEMALVGDRTVKKL